MTEGKVLGPKIYLLNSRVLGQRCMTFVLSMLVGMLSHPTLLLFLKFFMLFVYLVNGCLMKIVWLWNLIVKVTFKCCQIIIYIITQCYRNTIKIGIERICNCFRFSKVNSIEFNGGIDWTVFFYQECSWYSTIFSYCCLWKSLAGYENIAHA